MPRGVAEFEAIGCKVTPYPVDFSTGDSTALTEYSLANTLLRWQTALHEWLGLWVYGLTRSSGALNSSHVQMVGSRFLELFLL